MLINHFSLVLHGPNLQDDALSDTAFKAGCDGAEIGRNDGIHYADRYG